LLVGITNRSIYAMASASTLPNLYQGVEKESFGYKLLANLGWKEGQGLVRAVSLRTLPLLLLAVLLLLSAASTLQQAGTPGTCNLCSHSRVNLFFEILLTAGCKQAGHQGALEGQEEARCAGSGGGEWAAAASQTCMGASQWSISRWARKAATLDI
jgi:hypothetical protein